MTDSRISNGIVEVGEEEGQVANVPGGHSILLKADAANTGTIRIGTEENTAAGEGFPLAKGESIQLDVNNFGQVYASASAAAQKLYWLITSP